MGQQNWVIWIIFGLLLALLIGFLVFSFVKDKMKNKRLIQKRLELKRATIRTSKELAIKIYSLIQLNEEWVKEINPGQSIIKMKDVNFVSRSILKDIYESKAFKTIYIDSEDTDPNYAKNIKSLIDRKSNLWTKYCQNEIEYFKKFHDELINDEKFETIKNESIKDINETFNGAIKK